MAKIIFTRGASTFTFEKARKYPIDDPLKLNVVRDMSEGGVMYAYDKGIAEQFFILDFKGSTPNDRTNVLDWWENEAVGSKNTFTYTDEDGNNHTVRWIADEFSVPKLESDPGDPLYTIYIKLRKEV